MSHKRYVKKGGLKRDNTKDFALSGQQMEDGQLAGATREEVLWINPIAAEHGVYQESLF